MRLGILLYGQFGDVASLSALSNHMKGLSNDEWVLITKECYACFARDYGTFFGVIPFRDNDINGVIDAVNSFSLDCLADIHNTGYKSSKLVEWLGLVKVGKVRTTFERASMLTRDTESFFELCPKRVIVDGKHNIKDYLVRMGYDGIGVYENMLKIAPKVKDVSDAASIRLGLSNKFLVGIVLHAGFEYKVWPLPNWEMTVSLLKQNNCGVVVLAAEYEREKTSTFLEECGVDALFAHDVSDHVKHILAVDMVVATDTGLKNLAGYLEWPVVGLYGHSSPLVWGSLSSSEIVIRSNATCSPCNDPYKCSLGHPICYKMIFPNEVIKNVMSFKRGCL